MSVSQYALLVAIDTLVLATLVGVLVRRRYRYCLAFPVYLLTVFLADLPAYTEVGVTRSMWLISEAVHAVLKLAIAVELTARGFRVFPGARTTARNLLMVVLIATFIAIATVPVQGGLAAASELGSGDEAYRALASQVFARMTNGTVWLFVAVAMVILWYRLPVHPFHKAILLGFVPYLLVFTILLNFLRSTDWRYIEWVNIVAPLAYLAVVAYWTYAAWAPERAPFRPRAAQAAVRQSA